jgi:predicted phosphoribosyltransferase
MMYKDREEAGDELARVLQDYKNDKSTLILAIPRGGAVIASRISKALGIPWDFVVPKKIGAPHNPELAIGVVMQDGSVIVNENARFFLEVNESYLQQEKQRLYKEIQRRMQLYRKDRPYPELKDKRIILTDDGIATGFTVKGAIKFIRNKNPREIILAVPVAAPESLEELEPLVDRVVCPLRPRMFYAVGQFYEDFSQTTDEEVIRLFEKDSKGYDNLPSDK